MPIEITYKIKSRFVYAKRDLFLHLNMKNYLIVLFILIGNQIHAQSTRVISIQESIEFLASDDLKGRKTGTKYSKQALDYIAKKVKREVHKKLIIQDFEILIGKNDAIDAANGYIYLNNKKDSTILIGAHYDHIGMGGELSKTPGAISVHNGADDNASGVALLIDLASQLKKNKNHQYNYLIVFYDAHEIGLHGSSLFFDFLKNEKKIKPIAYQFNFDMVGRLNQENPKIKVTCNHNLNCLIENTFTINYYLGEESQLSNLDTKEFYKNGIRCFNISTGIHADYHTPSDDVQYINFEGIEMISNQVLMLISTL